VSEKARQILLFQVGTQLYAALAREVERVGFPGEVPREELVQESLLGLPLVMGRGLVVKVKERERMLLVDQVLGVRGLAEGALLPLPPFAAACLQAPVATGIVLLDEVPTPLVGLRTLLFGEAKDAPLTPIA